MQVPQNPAVIPPGWKTEWSKEHQQFYYININTWESTWSLPATAAQPPQRKPTLPIRIERKPIARQPGQALVQNEPNIQLQEEKIYVPPAQLSQAQAGLIPTSGQMQDNTLIHSISPLQEIRPQVVQQADPVRIAQVHVASLHQPNVVNHPAVQNQPQHQQQILNGCFPPVLPSGQSQPGLPTQQGMNQAGAYISPTNINQNSPIPVQQGYPSPPIPASYQPSPPSQSQISGYSPYTTSPIQQFPSPITPSFYNPHYQQPNPQLQYQQHPLQSPVQNQPHNINLYQQQQQQQNTRPVSFYQPPTTGSTLSQNPQGQIQPRPRPQSQYSKLSSSSFSSISSSLSSKTTTEMMNKLSSKFNALSKPSSYTKPVPVDDNVPLNRNSTLSMFSSKGQLYSQAQLLQNQRMASPQDQNQFQGNPQVYIHPQNQPNHGQNNVQRHSIPQFQQTHAAHPQYYQQGPSTSQLQSPPTQTTQGQPQPQTPHFQPINYQPQNTPQYQPQTPQSLPTHQQPTSILPPKTNTLPTKTKQKTKTTSSYKKWGTKAAIGIAAVGAIALGVDALDGGIFDGVSGAEGGFDGSGFEDGGGGGSGGDFEDGAGGETMDAQTAVDANYAQLAMEQQGQENASMLLDPVGTEYTVVDGTSPAGLI